MLDSGCWIQDVGFEVLDLAIPIADSGCWIRDANWESGIRNLKFEILIVNLGFVANLQFPSRIFLRRLSACFW